MNNEERKIGNQIIHVVRAPLRALCRARNRYVHSMNSIADHVPYGASGEAVSYANNYDDNARNFSNAQLSSGEEDFRELVRINSQSRVIASREAVWRSRSVAVGRIDEDAPCYFSGDVRVGESIFFFPGVELAEPAERGPLLRPCKNFVITARSVIYAGKPIQEMKHPKFDQEQPQNINKKAGVKTRLPALFGSVFPKRCGSNRTGLVV